MTATYRDAVEAVTEYVIGERPDNEREALDVAQAALDEFIDSALIYYHDALKLWDQSTNENVTLGDYDDIMSAITASTYFQLSAEWADAIYDGIDAAIWEYLPEWDDSDMDRDDALAHAFGTRD